jgi:hypothetical protein
LTCGDRCLRWSEGDLWYRSVAVVSMLSRVECDLNVASIPLWARRVLVTHDCFMQSRSRQSPPPALALAIVLTIIGSGPQLLSDPEVSRA